MFFKKKREPVNIEEVLESFKKLEEKVSSLEKEIDKMRQERVALLQGTGMVRFNPFPNIGGNQSFSFAILDGNKDGAIITGFYSHEGSSVYGKPIKNGKSEYALIKEEEEAISLASREACKNKK